MLTNQQRDVLLRPIKPSRVSTTQGMAYVEAFDVIAHLTRIFGFEGWDKEIIRLDVIHETEGTKNTKDRAGETPKVVWTVLYRCAMRLTVRDPEGDVIKIIEDVATGEAINQPSRGDAHDLACKTAVSTALKRCAKDLGDQFGLSLYDKGSLRPTILHLVSGERAGDAPPADISGLAEEAVTAEEAPSRDHSSPERSSAAPGAPLPMTVAQRGKIFATVKQHNMGEPHAVCSEILGRTVEHLNELTKAEAHKVIEGLHKRLEDSRQSR